MSYHRKRFELIDFSASSRNQYSIEFDDRSERTYLCECGNQYMDEETLRHHQVFRVRVFVSRLFHLTF